MKIGKFRIRQYRQGHWQVYFSDKNGRVFIQRTLDDKPMLSENDAIVAVWYLQKKGYHPQEWNRDKSYQFDVAIRTWTKNKNCSPEWKDHRRQIAKRFFIPFFGKRDIRTIKTIHIEELRTKLEERGLSDKYLYNILGELRAFFRFHKESIPDLPNFRKVEFQEPVIKWLDEDSQSKVFEFIPEEDLPIFVFMKHSGCRENEATGLLRKNVFLDKNPPFVVLATVRDRKGNIRPFTKTKKLKIIPIIPEIVWIFKESSGDFAFSRNGKPYSGKMLRQVWDGANKESGVDPCNLYNAMRHSFGCQRLNDGYSLDEIRAVMGHTDIRTTQRYAKYQIGRLQDIIRGKPVHRVITLPKTLQLPERIGGKWLGDEESNLDSRSQSPASYH